MRWNKTQMTRVKVTGAHAQERRRRDLGFLAGENRRGSGEFLLLSCRPGGKLRVGPAARRTRLQRT